MSNLNLSPDKMNLLLKFAGKQLGKQPDDIKNSLEQGDAQGLMQSLDQDSRNKVNQVLNDPKAMEQFMQNEQVKALLGKIMGGK